MITMSKPQAEALLRALFDEQVVGLDADGNTYGNERNTHFLTAFRAVIPEIPGSIYLLRTEPVVPEGAGPEDYKHILLAAWKENRRQFCQALHEFADALHRPSGEIPF